MRCGPAPPRAEPVMSERPAAARSLHLTKRLAGQVWTAIIQPTEGTHEPPSSTVGRAPGPGVAVPRCFSGTAGGHPRILRDRRTSLLDPSVRAGKHNGLMTVVVTDQVGPAAIAGITGDDDLARLSGCRRTPGRPSAVTRYVTPIRLAGQNPLSDSISPNGHCPEQAEVGTLPMGRPDLQRSSHRSQFWSQLP